MERIFIPSLLDDNGFLMKSDSLYKERLMALPTRERRALLFGDWDVFEGQYFTEFSRDAHVIEPFALPKGWRRYRTVDYGLDRLVCLWIAVSDTGEAYVYREFCESNLPIGDAARAIVERTEEDEDIYATLAPPDLFARSQETGMTKASLFGENGVSFTKTSNDRETGWLAIKELLSTRAGAPRLKIFSSCTELIRCLPALQVDKIRPTDCQNEPHDITHAPDALRGFAIFYARPNEQKPKGRMAIWSSDMWEDYYGCDEKGRQYLLKKYGEPI
jgi:hypothetical protein